jgi:hypothetical protein
MLSARLVRRTLLASSLPLMLPSLASAQVEGHRAIGANVNLIGCMGAVGRSTELQGVVIGLDTERVVVRDYLLRTVPMREVQSIDIRTGGTHRFAGATIGTAVGLIVGYAVSKPSEKDLRLSDGLAALQRPVGAFVGAVLGGVVGLIVTGPHWTSVALPAHAGQTCRSATPSTNAP